MTLTTIRTASPHDLMALKELDSVAPHDAHRVKQLQQWIQQGTCHLLEIDGVAIGYAVLHHHFFECGFIEMLMVGERFRRQGVGRTLIDHLAEVCVSAKLFSSTNASNDTMRRLFTTAGFIESGRIDNLDPDDPEILFFRALDRGADGATASR